MLHCETISVHPKGLEFTKAAKNGLKSHQCNCTAGETFWLEFVSVISLSHGLKYISTCKGNIRLSIDVAVRLYGVWFNWLTSFTEVWAVCLSTALPKC